MPAPIQPPEPTVTVDEPSALARTLARILTAMGQPDSVLMGLIRHGLTLAGGILVSRGVIDSSLADQLVGAAIVAAGTGWSVAAKYIVTHWLHVAVMAPATTTRAQLGAIVKEVPLTNVTSAEVANAVAGKPAA